MLKISETEGTLLNGNIIEIDEYGMIENSQRDKRDRVVYFGNTNNV